MPPISKDAVCPAPQNTPANDDRLRLLFVLTMVDTATR